MISIQKIGFVGLGVMGEHMCSNLVHKSGLPVHIFDQSSDAIARVVAKGGIAEPSLDALAREVDIVFLSLPSIAQVETVCASLMQASPAPRMIVDMSTSEVARTRALGERLAAVGITLVDAPVARTAEAAIKGTLFITVGSSVANFEGLLPFLKCMGSDVLHCGDIGCGQIVKILNNIMVFMTVNALSEVLTIGRRAGMDGKELFTALSLGSADSFTLRNHGMKSLVPDTFPEKVFPVDYAIKDASLALALAADGDFEPHIAKYTHDLLCKARDAGFSKAYHPAVINLVDGRVSLQPH
jgi:3-hydroxyisobutyrate dehydrogenase-like beta-hydroxyacid dehydrogenase